ncbi:unnamed protein product [Staurois parvus]|uniref:Uncharacterized protein n=2 Tax=Staurois parvus TaxID=386267 RepID=A0ABN9FTZ8_9NEOB|nr:unnamed protein product [Staurois parvus]
MGRYSTPRNQQWGAIPPTDTNDGGAIPPTDTNDGALFLPLTPMMGRYSTDTNDGALFLPLTPTMGRYSTDTTTMGRYSPPRNQPRGAIPPHRHQPRGAIPPTDTNDGVLFLQLTPEMGNLILPMTPMIVRPPPPRV